jgi:hypothetical protein
MSPSALASFDDVSDVDVPGFGYFSGPEDVRYFLRELDSRDSEDVPAFRDDFLRRLQSVVSSAR